MQKHKKTGHLHADLPKGVPQLRGPCRAEITLKTGKIVSCSITSSRGSFLSGDKAYQELMRLGRLHWSFVSQMPSVAQPGGLANQLEKKALSRPRRMVVLERWQMQSWPRIYQLVYGLVDGTRSVAEIAALLMTTAEAIEDVVRDLRSMRVIAMEE
jgi:hypothetical protein